MMPSRKFARVRGCAGSQTSTSIWPPWVIELLPVQSYGVVSVPQPPTLPNDCTLPSEVSAMLIGISGHGVTPLQAPAWSLAGGEQSAVSRPAA